MFREMLVLPLFIMMLPNTVFADDKDSNIVITSAVESYSFQYNTKNKEVDIRQRSAVTYHCNDFRVSIPVVEFYNDKSTIDNVTIYIDGDKAKNIKPTYSYYSIENIFYSDARICYFTLPFEKKGTNNQVIFEKTNADPRYFSSIYFTESYKVHNKEVTINVPRWMKVEFKEMNFEGFDIKKKVVYNASDDEEVITYSIKNLPLKEGEGHGPGPSYIEPHLLVLAKYANSPDGKLTYFNTLDDQYAWYRTLTKGLKNNSTTIKAKALELTAGSKTDLDKIKTIFYWMHNNIRYLAFEDGIAGFKPEDADEVLRKKYGDCKGMANLTKELLRSLGFDARLCWIGTNHIAYDYSTPSMAVDNHMICALLFEGKTYFLDATENYLGFNEYAERIQGRQVLIEDGDKYIYTKVPGTTYHQNLDIEKSILNISGTDITGKVSHEWKGEEKEYILAQLGNIKKEKTTDAFMRYLSDNNKDYQVKNFITSDVTDFDNNITVQYDLEHKNAVTAFGNDLYIDIDYHKELAGFTFTERENDYWFSYKFNTQREVQLEIPPGYVISALPPNVSVKNDDYEFTAAITQQPGKLLYKKTILVKNPVLAKSKFPQWNKDVEKLKNFYNEQVALTIKK